MRLTIVTTQLTNLRLSLESPLKSAIDKEPAKSPGSEGDNDWQHVEHSDIPMNGFH